MFPVANQGTPKKSSKSPQYVDFVFDRLSVRVFLFGGGGGGGGSVVAIVVTGATDDDSFVLLSAMDEEFEEIGWARTRSKNGAKVGGKHDEHNNTTKTMMSENTSWDIFFLRPTKQQRKKTNR